MGVTSAATGRIRHEDRVLACVSGNIQMSSNDPVQDMVAESWKRCAQSYRLDPARRSETRILTQAELRDFREPAEPLVRIAKAEIQRLHRQVNAADHVVLLTDRNGVAIVATHSPVILQEVPKSCSTPRAVNCSARKLPCNTFRSIHAARNSAAAK